MTRDRCAARALVFAALLLGFASVGCADPGGAWNNAGFEQKTYGWKAKFAPGTKSSLLGTPWRLDNWELSIDDATLRQKRGEGYDVQVWEDENDDGKVDSGEASTKPMADLKFTNSRDNGFIFVTTRVLSARQASKDLDVLLGDIGESLLAGGQGSLAGGKLLGFVTTKKETLLGSRAAISEVVEIASPDLIKADPKARTGKLCLVLSRFTFAEPTSTSGAEPAPPTKTGVLLVAYYNDVTHFHDHLKAFDDFLGRIAWMPPSDAPLKAPARSAPANAAPTAPSEEKASQPGAPPPSSSTDASEI